MRNIDMINEDALFQKLETNTLEREEYVRYSVWKDISQEIKKSKLAMFCLIVLSLIIIASLLAPLSPYDPDKISVNEKLLPPSGTHWFGTDDFGRDYFTRALYGGRISLLVGTASMIVTMVVGSAIGILSGYVGGKPDKVLMRITDIILALPSILLMIVLNTVLRPGLTTLIVVLSLFSWAPVARITRAETLSLKQRDFIHASRNLGASGLRITLQHILPGLLGPMTVSISLGVANAILSESSLSFLGLGVQVPQASWGSMLNGAQAYVLDAPLLAVYPGLLILLTVLSFNVLGDVLRNALEPKIVK